MAEVKRVWSIADRARDMETASNRPVSMIGKEVAKTTKPSKVKR